MKRWLSSYRVWVMFALALFALGAQAQQDKWVSIGKARMSSNSTVSFIPADTAVGTLCSVRVKVEDFKSIEIREVTVHFGNSQTMHFAMDYKISNDNFSPSINLQGKRRTVQGIDVVYSRLDPTAGVPTVDLWGNELIGALSCPR